MEAKELQETNNITVISRKKRRGLSKKAIIIISSILGAVVLMGGGATIYSYTKYGMSPASLFVSKSLEKQIQDENNALTQEITNLAMQTTEETLVNNSLRELIGDGNLEEIADYVINTTGNTLFSKEEIIACLQAVLGGDTNVEVSMSEDLQDYVYQFIANRLMNNNNEFIDSEYVYSQLTYQLTEDTINSITNYLKTINNNLTEEELKSYADMILSSTNTFMSKNDIMQNNQILNQSITNLNTDLNTKYAQVTENHNILNNKVQNLIDNDIKNINNNISDVEDRAGALEGRADLLEERADSFEQNITNINNMTTFDISVVGNTLKITTTTVGDKAGNND